MNEYDRNQFDFIMRLTEEEFDQWADILSDEDLDYAIDLIRQMRSDLIMAEHELTDNLDKSDCEQARILLRQFQL